MDENKEDDNKDDEDRDKTEKHDEKEGDDDAENEDDDNKTGNKRKQKYKMKVDIKQGEKDYQKWMLQLKAMQCKGGKKAVANMDKKLCHMIITYWSKLMEEGIDVMADAAQQEIVDVHHSDEEKEYIDLDMVRQ